GVLATLDLTPQLPAARRGDVLALAVQLRLPGVPSLDRLGQPDLVILGEQRILPNIGEIEPDEVLLVALDSLLCQNDEPLVSSHAARNSPASGSPLLARRDRPISSLPGASRQPVAAPAPLNTIYRGETDYEGFDDWPVRPCWPSRLAATLGAVDDADPIDADPSDTDPNDTDPNAAGPASHSIELTVVTLGFDARSADDGSAERL